MEVMLTPNRMIAIFDEDGGGDVDFQEFVSGLSAFSSKGNKEQKLRFAFKVYDIDRDGYISNGELFIVLKMMVGNNLKDQQLQQIVDKTIMEADLDGDGKISFEEFTKMVENTDVSMSMTLGKLGIMRVLTGAMSANPCVQINFKKSIWIHTEWWSQDGRVVCETDTVYDNESRICYRIPSTSINVNYITMPEHSVGRTKFTII